MGIDEFSAHNLKDMAYFESRYLHFQNWSAKRLRHVFANKNRKPLLYPQKGDHDVHYTDKHKAPETASNNESGNGTKAIRVTS